MSDSTRTRTISFSDLHYELTSKLAKDHQMGFSAVVRLVYDYAIDRDPELGMLFYEDKRKTLRAELASVDEMVRELEAKREAEDTDLKVFEETGTCNRVTSQSSRTNPATEHENASLEKGSFLRLAPKVADGDDTIPPTTKRWVFTRPAMHPEWLTEVPEPQRGRLQAMLESESR